MLEESLVDGGGIETPARGQEWNFFHISHYGFVQAIWKWLGRIGIIEALETQFPFAEGRFALVPESPPGPGVGSNDPAVLGLDPGVKVQNAAGIKKLEAAKLAAHFQNEAKTRIDVVVWFRQSGAKHDDPPFDRRSYEEFLVSGQSFEP